MCMHVSSRMHASDVTKDANGRTPVAQLTTHQDVVACPGSPRLYIQVQFFRPSSDARER